MERFTVHLYRPLVDSALTPLLDSWTFGTDEVRAEWTTHRVGGFGTLEVRAPSRFGGASMAEVLRRPDICLYAHVEAVIGGTVVFEGFITDFLRSGAVVDGFRAQGYGTALDHLPFTGTTGNVLTVLRQAIQETAPYLRFAPDSLVINPGYELQDAQVKRMMFNDLVKLISENGSLDGWPVRCQVWEGRAIHILADIPPQPADWLVQADDPGLHLDDIDGRKLIGAVTVEAGARTVRMEDPTFRDRFGVLRERTLTLDENASDAQMRAMARGYLARWSRPIPSGRWEITSGRAAIPSGATLPAWRMRAGEWLIVADANEPPSQILETRTEWPGGRVQVQFGAIDPNEELMEDIGMALNALHRRIVPTSWTRG